MAHYSNTDFKTNMKKEVREILKEHYNTVSPIAVIRICNLMINTINNERDAPDIALIKITPDLK